MEVPKTYAYDETGDVARAVSADGAPADADELPEEDLPHTTKMYNRAATHLKAVVAHPHVKRITHHANENKHAAAFIGVMSLALLLTFVSWLFRRVSRRLNGKRSKPTARAALPAFDMEGGSPGVSSGSFLHPSIAQAAKTADVGTLRQWLQDERCVVDAQLAAGGATALHAAAAAGHANVVRLLIDEGGADALVVDGDLRTPLHLVALYGHGLCVKALLDAGADAEATDGKGETPLTLAEGARHVGTARMMRLHAERRAASNGGLRRGAR